MGGGEAEGGAGTGPVEDGDRAFIVAEGEAIAVHQKDNDTKEKVSALTAALLVHVAIALLLTLYVISVPPTSPRTSTVRGGSGDVQLPLGEEVKHDCLAVRYGGVGLGIGFVDQPSLALAIELRIRGFRDNHVDLAIGMAVIRPFDIVHQHHIDRKTAGFRALLDDAAEFDAAMLAVAKPAFIDFLPANLGPAVQRLPARRKSRIQSRPQLATGTLAVDTSGNGRHRFGESLLSVHQSLLTPPRV